MNCMNGGGAQTLDDLLMENVNNATDNTDTHLNSSQTYLKVTCVFLHLQCHQKVLQK